MDGLDWLSMMPAVALAANVSTASLEDLLPLHPSPRWTDQCCNGAFCKDIHWAVERLRSHKLSWQAGTHEFRPIRTFKDWRGCFGCKRHSGCCNVCRGCVFVLKMFLVLIVLKDISKGDDPVEIGYRIGLDADYECLWVQNRSPNTHVANVATLV